MTISPRLFVALSLARYLSGVKQPVDHHHIDFVSEQFLVYLTGDKEFIVTLKIPAKFFDAIVVWFFRLVEKSSPQ